MSAAKALVRHLLRCQVDNPDHIALIDPLTETHSLLMSAAEDVFGESAASLIDRIEAERAKIESYRPLVAEVDRQRDKADRYERALSTIAYDHPIDPTEAARAALEAP